MTTVRPGRLAVRHDPEDMYPDPKKCYTIVSTVKLPGYSRSTTGRFPGLWCWETLGWENAQRDADEHARTFRERLIADAVMKEPS